MLIDKQAICKSLEARAERWVALGQAYKEYASGIMAAVREIYAAPAASEEKRGQWLQDYQGAGDITCSCCGRAALWVIGGFQEQTEHCPHCGAIMEEVQDDGR